jgi:hypothetical protein
MTPTEARANVNRWWTDLSAAMKAVVALMAILASIGAGYIRYAALPRQVASLEHWRDSTVTPALLYLVCSQRAVNEGRDPKPCDIVLQGVDEMLRGPRQ